VNLNRRISDGITDMENMTSLQAFKTTMQYRLEREENVDTPTAWAYLNSTERYRFKTERRWEARRDRGKILIFGAAIARLLAVSKRYHRLWASCHRAKCAKWQSKKSVTILLVHIQEIKTQLFYSRWYKNKAKKSKFQPGQEKMTAKRHIFVKAPSLWPRWDFTGTKSMTRERCACKALGIWMALSEQMPFQQMSFQK
jgi:hypothetical protein